MKSSILSSIVRYAVYVIEGRVISQHFFDSKGYEVAYIVFLREPYSIRTCPPRKWHKKFFRQSCYAFYDLHDKSHVLVKKYFVNLN